MVPPDPAKDAYNMVIQARSTLETTRTNAQAVHDAAVTKAQGQKTTLITDAERERTQTVEEARGEADRFKQVLVQFTANPESTRWNLFLDPRQVNRIVGQPISQAAAAPLFPLSRVPMWSVE
jgi:membrane protease subunit HflK